MYLPSPLKDFRKHFESYGLTITNEPVETPAGVEKFFEITINGKLVWSRTEVVDAQPEASRKSPLLFNSNKWWGEPNAEWISYVEGCINAAKA